MKKLFNNTSYCLLDIDFKWSSIMFGELLEIFPDFVIVWGSEGILFDRVDIITISVFPIIILLIDKFAFSMNETV